MSAVLPLARMLARPSRQGRAAIVLPVVAFAVTTALLLVVAGGAAMFLVDPRAVAGGGLYGTLAVLALVLLALVQGFVIKPFQVPSESMSPTLEAGDRLLASRIAYSVSA
ncbi:S26 family signal peptidase, partial [Pseudomonas aeruginosa]|uniref:S26 family signal peptidase n=1 Tax=Pseudomonas aeruginosa TaxID=287 RepID=UPI002B410E07